MSGSPKVSYASVSPEVENMLAAERLRQAELAAADWREAAERARLRKQTELVDAELRRRDAERAAHFESMRSRAATLRRQLHGLAAEIEERHDIRTGVPHAVDLARECERLLGRTVGATAEECGQLEGEVTALSLRWSEFRAAHEARATAALQATRAQATVSEAAALLATTNPREAHGIDAAGRDETLRELEMARSMVAAGRFEDALRCGERARERARRHVAQIQSGRAHWQRRCDATESRLAEVAAEVTTVPEAVRLWSTPLLTNAQAAVAEAERLWTSGLPDSAQEQLDRAQAYLAEAIRGANERQAQEDRRRHIVTAIHEALKVDFAVRPPQLEAGADGAVVIHAFRPSGQTLDVRIERDGALKYQVQGYPLRSAAVEGEVLSTCDEAMSDILRLHERIAARGVGTTDLTWPGSQPTRPLAKQGQQAQHPSPASRSRSGGLG